MKDSLKKFTGKKKKFKMVIRTKIDGTKKVISQKDKRQ